MDGGDQDGGEGATPRCPTCKRPTDDIEAMSEAELLELIRVETLRDLARTLRGGSATHQELQVARAMLKDNKSMVPEDPAEPGMPAPKGKMPLPGKREFPAYDHDE